MSGPACLRRTPSCIRFASGCRPGAWDTHVHAIGDAERFPLAATARTRRHRSRSKRTSALMDRLGIARAVLVQPSIYGTDNRAMLDALRRYPARFRGVAVVGAGIADRDMAGAACRRRARRARESAQCRAAFRSPMPVRSRSAWPISAGTCSCRSTRRRSMGSTRSRNFPVDVVIDHMGYMQAGKGPSNPGFRRLLKLVEAGRCWVKLSAPYRLTDWNARRLCRRSAACARARSRESGSVLWASDWPHTDLRNDMPNDADLLDLLGEWVDDARAREAVLVTNPAIALWRVKSGARIRARDDGREPQVIESRVLGSDVLRIIGGRFLAGSDFDETDADRAAVRLRIPAHAGRWARRDRRARDRCRRSGSRHRRLRRRRAPAPSRHRAFAAPARDAGRSCSGNIPQWLSTISLRNERACASVHGAAATAPPRRRRTRLPAFPTVRGRGSARDRLPARIGSPTASAAATIGLCSGQRHPLRSSAPASASRSASPPAAAPPQRVVVIEIELLENDGGMHAATRRSRGSAARGSRGAPDRRGPRRAGGNARSTSRPTSSRLADESSRREHPISAMRPAIRRLHCLPGACGTTRPMTTQPRSATTTPLSATTR